MKRLLASLPVMAILSAGCNDQPNPNPDPIPNEPPIEEPTGRVPSALSVEWQPVDNLANNDAKFFRSTFTLSNKGPDALGNEGWKLYFSFVRRILADGEGEGSIQQSLARQGVKISVAGSGDYYVIEPLPNFQPIAAGGQRVIEMLASDWAILKTDAPAGFHITFSGEKFSGKTAFAVPSTVKMDASDPKQTTRFPGDALPVQTTGLRFTEGQAAQTLDLQARLLPVPRTVQAGTGTVTLKDSLTIGYSAQLKNEATYLSSALEDVVSASIGSREATGGETIRLELQADSQLGAEGYTLDVKDGVVIIRGATAAGVFYGIQTLRQLIPTETYLAATQASGRPAELVLPVVHIADAPGFVYRGMALDVGRHFQSKETVKRLLDVLAHYKINKFHFHLTDDEGWRLEIPGLPELTSYGSRRGFDVGEQEMLHVGLGSANDFGAGDQIDLKPPLAPEAAPLWAVSQGFVPETLNFLGKGSGYYTTRDFEEILVYATERHIEVIPEVDVPGHARAAVLAMEYRYRKLKDSDPAQAAAYRLLDPADTSKHRSVQMYTDNFINPCLETSYAFLGKVVEQIQARYTAVGLQLKTVHGGGDELPSLNNNVWWQDSPLCKQNPETKELGDLALANHFFKRWHQIITATGAKMTGWDDIIHHGQDLDGFIPMPWSNVWGWGREDDAYKFANQGYKVILSHSTNLYIDLAHNKDPDEPGYYWANFVDVKKTFEYRPFNVYANATHNRMGVEFSKTAWDDKVKLSPEGKKNILGMHGLLWAENLKSAGVMEYMAFPKMLGVAERAWNPELPAESEMPALWARFTNSLGQSVLPRLGAYRPVDLRGELPDQVGVNYRIPLPGAKLENGQLHANVLFPGLAIEFSTDEGATWKPYTEPVAASGKVLLRTRAPDGRTSRVSELK